MISPKHSQGFLDYIDDIRLNNYKPTYVTYEMLVSLNTAAIKLREQHKAISSNLFKLFEILKKEYEDQIDKRYKKGFEQWNDNVNLVLLSE